MATRENQGLQIGLIVCVMLIVGLFVGLFVLWRTNNTLDVELAHSRREASQNRQGIAEANDKLTKVKDVLGYPQEATVEEIMTNHVADMTKFAETWPLEQRNYRELASYLVLQYQDKTKRVTEEVTRVEQTRNERDQAREQDEKNSEKYTQDQDQLAKELADANTQFTEDRNQLNEDKTNYSDQVVQVKSEKDTMEAKKNERIAFLDQELKESKNVSQVLRDRIDNLTLKNPGQADGQITWVNHRDGYVYLDVGSHDGLRPQTTFAVFDETEVNVKVENKKGDIEVTRVLGPNRSVARVLENDISKMILPRDTVYSTAWDRGRHLHFGLAGLLDIDGDNESDIETIRNIISLNGGIIDAEVDENGNQKGELSMQTRFLIVGLKPGEMEQWGQDDEDEENAKLSEKDRERFSAAAETFQQIFGQAQHYSVERISLDEFLDLMGWHPAEKVTKLGTFSRTDNLGEENNESDGFRERQPPTRSENGAF